MTEPTIEVQQAIIRNMIAQHQQSAYSLQIQYRVSKKIGATPEELRPIEEAMLKTEKYIDAYEAELKSLDDQPMKK